MGLFKRVECNEEAEQPSMSAAELEQMVYATYQEKLDLAKQLDGAKARIESLEETLQEKTTKLRAAEEFARQSESERKSTASKIEPLEQSKKQLQTNLKQEKARAATLEVRIEELENASRGRMAAYRRELVEEMQRQKGVKGYRYPQNTKRRPQRPREPRMRRNLGRSEYGKRHLAGFKHPARLH